MCVWGLGFVAILGDWKVTEACRISGPTSCRKGGVMNLQSHFTVPTTLVLSNYHDSESSILRRILRWVA